MTVPSAGRPWLVADIGGTNARFALIEAPGAAPSQIQVLNCADYPGLTEAAETYLAAFDDVRPTAGCVAVAAATQGGAFRMTNAHWSGTAAQIQDDLGLDRLELINDFMALACALPSLGPADLRAIGPADPPAGGTRRPELPVAVLGPGTGLGMAGLVPARGTWVPIAAEGGHADLPYETPGEVEVVRLLRARRGSAHAELVLSGPGLVRLYGLLAEIHGVTAEPRTAGEICAGTDALCTETLAMFCALLGSFAGNAALTLGARGGVFLGGGILPRIADTLDHSDFRGRFEAKSPAVRDYLRAIPTLLIIAPTPALAGAGAWLRDRLSALETVL
jgi:glucokinase